MPKRAGQDISTKTGALRADYLAGAWAADLLMETRAATQAFGLSPDDLDKAISALFVFPGFGNTYLQGDSSERVDAYRKGVFHGAEPCLTL